MTGSWDEGLGQKAIYKFRFEYVEGALSDKEMPSLLLQK